MLNVKQEKFIQNIMNGMSQRQAYKDAYDAKYKDKIIDEKASRLFNSDKVQARYKELLQELEDKSIMSAKERMKWLTQVINNEQREEVKIKPPNGEEFVVGQATASLDIKMKAIDMLNKMSGEYKAKLETDIEFNIRVDLDD